MVRSCYKAFPKYGQQTCLYIAVLPSSSIGGITPMGDFDRGPRRDGGNRGGGFRGGNRGGFNRGPREMHKAVCSDCGKECEVPFKPSGDRPVYCKECFMKHKKY
jgi:CxxC-x17-CxxC domain-containing protein